MSSLDASAAGSDDQRLRDAGFRVQVITPRALHQRYAIEAAPVLIVAKPDGEALDHRSDPSASTGYDYLPRLPLTEDTAAVLVEVLLRGCSGAGGSRERAADLTPM